MKNKKRIILVVFCFLMLFASSAYAKPSKAKVKKAYKKYASENINVKSYDIVKYIDINRDGVKEMLYCNNSGLYPLWEVYTYKKGKVLKAGQFWGSEGVFFSSKKKRIAAESYSGGGAFLCVYKLSGSKLKCVTEYRMGELVMGGKYGLKNGKKISAEKYYKETGNIHKWKRL